MNRIEKEDWYFVIGVLMWLIDKIENHIDRKEQKKKTPKNKKRK